MGSAAPGSRSACGARATRKGQDAHGAQGRAVAVGWMKRLKACLRGVALHGALGWARAPSLPAGLGPPCDAADVWRHVPNSVAVRRA